MEKARAMLRLEEEFEEELKDITGNYTGASASGFRPGAQPGCCRPWWRPNEQEFPNVDVILYEGIQGVLDKK